MAIPVHFAALATLLTGPTCQCLEGTAVGQALSHSLTTSLDSLAAASVMVCPTHACANILYAWYAVLCVALLLLRYHIERRRRARFAAPARLKCGWPTMPLVCGAVLQAAAALQLLSILWAALQCMMHDA